MSAKMKREIDERELGQVESALTDRITASVSPYHTVEYARRELVEAGFDELDMEKPWELSRGKRYVVSVYGSTLCAFQVGENWEGGSLRMAASHTDFPCLKMKPSGEIAARHAVKCNVDVYGGAILNTWMDRPLSMAGRVAVQGESILEPQLRLVDLQRPLFVIPNLAIHMNRDVNKGVELNRQKDLLPLLALEDGTEDGDKTSGRTGRRHHIPKLLGEQLGIEPEKLLDWDLSLYPVERPVRLGASGEMYCASRLDNITSVQACVRAIQGAGRKDGLNLIMLYDSEEVGSGTKQGAGSVVTRRILQRIYRAFGYDGEQLDCAMAGALGLSVDVAHALHPNVPEKSDPTNPVYMNRGFAIKTAVNERYASDQKVLAVLLQLCQREGLRCQRFVNRSDLVGGSTLGAIAVANLPIPMLDIGVPILAMHSARETFGLADQYWLEKAVASFLSCES